MIVNLTRKLILLILISLFHYCNIYEDIRLEKQGCNYNSQIIILCQGFLERAMKNQTPKNYEILPCLTVIYDRQECERKLRESDIP